MNDNLFDTFEPILKVDSETKGEVSRRFGDIFDLANAFLSIESMTHKKLQKMCYYAKAWYLAINDRNIIVEPFEAWIHGAVQPELYSKYKAFGFQLITMYIDTESKLPMEFTDFAKEIYASYGELSGDQLEQLNHQEEPWIKARQGLKPWENSNNTINENDMKNFYRSMMENA